MEPTRHCNECNEVKPWSEFYMNKATGKPWGRKCKVCKSRMTCERQAANRDHVRRLKDKREYGLTYEEADRLRSVTNCQVCGAAAPGGPNSLRRLHIDHCHTSGQVRGVLCGDCNTALGRAKDDPEILRKLALYLEKGVQ